MDMTLAWWNTALSPTRASDRARRDELDVACAVVRQILSRGKADFIALGEVSERDVAALQHGLDNYLNDYVFLPTREKAGLSNFDTGVICRKSLKVTQGQLVVRSKLKRVTRVAQQFDIELPDAKVLTAYVSHWPSRLNMGGWDPDRMALGNTLRGAVDIALENAPMAPIALLGDFNDEPFDPVMDNALFSSRDRALVSGKAGLLYNPFWRHMTSYEHVDAEHQFSDRGTYFHAAGQLSRWRTFDQMMFSSSLVNGESGWILDEQATRVFNIPALIELVESRKSLFDHLPIIGRLAKV